ncbi:hypothetical protein NLG97_g4371 [Lecanicillium saksenae]|uniref:Uncharacterized protein n=1 Tax=Lecanicillium saksenae TaxID=468837 RepID=A0ACC1QWP2_9HYPO|nr:hypothetical protein NLG97_g4371 [Lecanicillium saksenae]
MARTKQVPSKRQSSSEFFNKETAEWEDSNGKPKANGSAAKATAPAPAKAEAGVAQLVIAVSGIYASIPDLGIPAGKTHDYAPRPRAGGLALPRLPQHDTVPVRSARRQRLPRPVDAPGGSTPPIIPSPRILAPLALVAVTSSLASPFGYASLAHIDYITFLLAKSCKLLPVMFLHITVFRKRYPLYKYLVVAAVTAGVAVFTLHSGSKKKKASKLGEDANVAWGMLLLGINLLFDGLTNSTQDYIFSSFQPYTGPQMMCANNMMSSLVTGLYLLVGPTILAVTGAGEWLGLGSSDAGELGNALAFMGRYPAVWKDVIGFAACGAVGQVFIFYTLSTFSSVLLVTVTVTRKMFTMILSVLAFGHRLTQMQWLGVGLVFGGIGVEASIARREKLAKEEAKKAKHS